METDSERTSGSTQNCASPQLLSSGTVSIDIIVKDDDAVAMRYPGGKGKCYQHLINLMPLHETYIEPFLGGGAVLRNKRPATRTIGLDIDPHTIARWERVKPDGIELVHGDAFFFLKAFHYTGNELVYVDPPYLPATRKRAKVYRHDLDRAGHERLLELLVTLPCRVMVSGYDSDLYQRHLSSWRRFTFTAKAHDGVRQECVWINYAPPGSLHDARYIGSNFRERQTVQRRRQRLRSKIQDLSLIERAELLSWLQSTMQNEENRDATLLRSA